MLHGHTETGLAIREQLSSKADDLDSDAQPFTTVTEKQTSEELGDDTSDDNIIDPTKKTSQSTELKEKYQNNQ
jgi:hypothetical protein